MGTKLATSQFENQHARSTRLMATAVMDWPLTLATTFMVLSIGLTGCAFFALFVTSAQPVIHTAHAVLPD